MYNLALSGVDVALRRGVESGVTCGMQRERERERPKGRKIRRLHGRSEPKETAEDASKLVNFQEA